MAYKSIVYIGTAHLLTAFMFTVNIRMACIVTPYIVTANTLMTDMVMAGIRLEVQRHS